MGMMRFEFATATQIVFGDGAVSRLPGLVAPHGSRALVVTGSNPRRARPVLDALAAEGIETGVFRVEGEPSTDVARAGVAKARECIAHVVVGVGGGSVLDTGKAVAALLTNGGDPLDYLEVIGAGKKITKPSAPYVAVPTTAGTGAEVTKNAVLSSDEHHVKVSLRSHLMLPRVALVDPELTHSMPPAVTASTGLDALTQVIEPFVSKGSNGLTDLLCRDGIQRAARSLRRAFQHGEDIAARRDMALTSLFGGLALANAKLGAVHGFAGPLGGMFNSPHGALCARLLAPVMRVNIAALRQRDPDNVALSRYTQVARLLTGRQGAQPEDGATWAAGLCQQLDIPRLSAYGVKRDAVPAAVRKAKASSSMKGNPVALEDEELIEILELSI
jgi:alcohol dehydrogenase class IV